jgi:plasmid stabilization system protein ParE
MIYQVILQPLADEDLQDAYRWAAKHAPNTAGRWLVRFHDSLATLTTHPERCGFAPERKRLRRELRQMLVGRRPNVFRVVFVIEPQVVRVVRICRATRRRLKLSDLDE